MRNRNPTPRRRYRGLREQAETSSITLFTLIQFLNDWPLMVDDMAGLKAWYAAENCHDAKSLRRKKYWAGQMHRYLNRAYGAKSGAENGALD